MTVEPSRSGTCLPYKRLERSFSMEKASALSRLSGSPGRTRTSDMLINSQPLYQLSYRGMTLFYPRQL